MDPTPPQIPARQSISNPSNNNNSNSDTNSKHQSSCKPPNCNANLSSSSSMQAPQLTTTTTTQTHQARPPPPIVAPKKSQLQQTQANPRNASSASISLFQSPLKHHPQQQQRASINTITTAATSQTTATTPTNYISNLVNKSSVLLDSLKQQYTSLTTSASSSSGGSLDITSQQQQQQQQQHSSSSRHQTLDRIQSTASAATSAFVSSSPLKGSGGETNRPLQAMHSSSNENDPPTMSTTTTTTRTEIATPTAATMQRDSREAGKIIKGHPQARPCNEDLATQAVRSISGDDRHRFESGGGGVVVGTGAAISPARRHALQEHTFERDAARSVAPAAAAPLLAPKSPGRFKRASSIKSALKHAHLGALRPSASKRAAERASAVAAAAAGSCLVSGNLGAHRSQDGSSMPADQQQLRSHKLGKCTGPKGPVPRELFEPPITQRTLQRSRRRGAMQSDPNRRQMSMDTIGLRQLTDEYLQNAGVKPVPASASSQVSTETHQTAGSAITQPTPVQTTSGGSAGFVALDRTTTGSSLGGVSGGGANLAAIAAGSPSVIAAVAAASAPSGARQPSAGGAGSSTGNLTSQQLADCALEAQLYQAAKQASARYEAAIAANSAQITAGQLSSSSSGVGRNNWSSSRTASCSLQSAVSTNPAASSMLMNHASGGGNQLPRTKPTRHSHHHNKVTSASFSFATANSSDSQDSFSQVTMLPGNLPWQCDVSIQCELINAPPMFDEPYESTGDILNTIVGPFKGGQSFDSSGSGSGAAGANHNNHNHHHHHHHYGHAVSATLKRGLSAINSHHLSPPVGSTSSSINTTNTNNSMQPHNGPMALNTMVGHLKKSLSNTLDISRTGAGSGHVQQHSLQSQDSLPVCSASASAGRNNYELLRQANSLALDNNNNNSDGFATCFSYNNNYQLTSNSNSGSVDNPKQQQQHESGGFINQLASKLTRQSSKKFSVSRKGLKRALSFDCRGYKRLDDQASRTALGASGDERHRHLDVAGSGTHLSTLHAASNSLFAAARHRAQNRSTLALHVANSSNNASNSNNNTNSSIPRPYLPQSASQVDFQLPLLPYERMQEAIVSQRLLEPPPQVQTSGDLRTSGQSSASGGGGGSSSQAISGTDHHHQYQRQLNANELICGVGNDNFQRQQQQQQANANSSNSSSSSSSSTSCLDNCNATSNQLVGSLRRQQALVRPTGRPGRQLTSDQSNGNSSRETDSIGSASGLQVAGICNAVNAAAASPSNNATKSHQDQVNASNRMTQPPRLVLNIPTIATPPDDDSDGQDGANYMSNRHKPDYAHNEPVYLTRSDTANDDDETTSSRATTIAVANALTPNVTIDQAFNCTGLGVGGAGNSIGVGGLSQSPSFCIDPDGKSANFNNDGTNQLTASDVFNRSKNFIKRPSTMMASDAMNQVAQALESSHHHSASSANNQRAVACSATINQSPSIRRNRRQAIVPPKLVTDAQSESENDEPEVGQLIDVSDGASNCTGGQQTLGYNTDEDDDDDNDIDDNARNSINIKNIDKSNSDARKLQNQEEWELLTANRRRRSGGNEPVSHRNRAAATITTTTTTQQNVPNRPQVLLTGSQGNLTTHEYQARPDSQATLADSVVSSAGSSGNLTGRQSGAGGTLSPSGFDQGAGGRGLASPGASSLGVPFAQTTRRRSSIAVIPQMQICPGDLLVYSKQLIDRMNQSDSNEPPPQFLTIDDKKGKNIWSSFKLCAQFDNRTMRARNELLCSLEDVLASLQPSTFVDEQLSHYKGMLWNEFLFETESRRSASSEGLNSMAGDDNLPPQVKPSYGDDLVEIRVDSASPVHQTQQTNARPGSGHRQTGESVRSTGNYTKSDQNNTNSNGNNTISATDKDAAISKTSSTNIVNGSPNRTPGGAIARTITSRFREKPQLKRGQTVDSVFRLPLILSSPLKHAQQHQQTPTAHLDNHHDLITTIEDDERSSISSSGGSRSGRLMDNAKNDTPSHSRCDSRRKRSSSTRSRNGSRSTINCNENEENKLNTTQQQQQQNRHFNSELGANYADNRSQDSSSFEADDASDLLAHSTAINNDQRHHQKARSSRQTPNQIVRQSSLSTLASTITRTEQKRQMALWDLFQSECTFFFDHLMTLKNVYMEPLKKIQVEGFAMFADPDVLFGNLDELCCGVYDFCKEFLYIIMRTLKTRPEELNATDVLIKLYKKNPKIDHLRAVYHRYTLNYINALTYLESLRRQVEFVEFEKWSSRDVRCKKLQLTDLLVAPVQHIMRVPIILKDIESHTENIRDRDEIRAILAVEEASLRELDDKMRWLKNFERLLEIQKNISWPSVLDMDPKLYIPEFLKDVLSKQPCEKLIVSPRRQIVHEGTLSNFDIGKACDLHVILFDDMLLMTRRKKGLTKKSSTVCKTNSSGGSSGKDDGSFKYIIYKQPLSLDRFYVHDIQQTDAQAIGIKFLFLLIVMNRFQQIINVHSFSAPNEDMKQTWLFKIKKTAERWKRNFSSESNNDQQQQHQQAQSLSACKSVPPDANACGSSTKAQPMLQTPTKKNVSRPQQQQQQSTISSSNNSPRSYQTKQYLDDSGASTKQNSDTNESDKTAQISGSGTLSNYTAKQQPIELIVTSASESLNESHPFRMQPPQKHV